MKQNPQNTPVQRSFADIPNDDRPAPIIASEQWGFELQSHEIEGISYFAALDWIRGLLGDDANASQIWRDFKRNSLKNDGVDSIHSLNYLASDGKNYKRDFADDRILYLLSQYMRPTEGRRELLDAVRQFLARSGSQMDDWRRNPDKMLSVAQSRMLSDIERHEKAGLGNRPEIELLRSKVDATKTLKELKHSVTRLLDMSNQDWANFHNDELWHLLGYTAKQIKAARDPKKSGRDNLNIFELNSLKYAETQLIALLSMQNKIDRERLNKSVQFIFAPVGESLRGLLESIGIDVLSGKYQLPSGGK